MRKILLLLAVVVAVTGAVLLFHNKSQAQIPQYRYVEGYTYREGGKIGNCTVQASSNSGSTWIDVAVSNDNGYYYWDPVMDPNGFPNGWINMHIKRTCGGSDPQCDPTDTPSWLYYSQSGLKTTVDVHSDYCP